MLRNSDFFRSRVSFLFAMILFRFLLEARCSVLDAHWNSIIYTFFPFRVHIYTIYICIYSWTFSVHFHIESTYKTLKVFLDIFVVWMRCDTRRSIVKQNRIEKALLLLIFPSILLQKHIESFICYLRRKSKNIYSYILCQWSIIYLSVFIDLFAHVWHIFAFCTLRITSHFRILPL